MLPAKETPRRCCSGGGSREEVGRKSKTARKQGERKKTGVGPER